MDMNGLFNRIAPVHSISGLRPEYDDVVADLEVADRALQLLAGANRKE